MSRPIGLLIVGASLLAACQTVLGSLLVVVSFEADTKTACVSVSVGHGRPAVAVKRKGLDRLEIAVSEDGDLTGAVTVTVQRFATDACTQPIGQAVAQNSTLARGQQERLDFIFTDERVDTDAGVDAGRPDAGPPPDGGCDLGRCASAPPCAQGVATCLADGGCGFSLRDAGPCGDAGLCTAAGLCVPQCEVLAPGALCDDRVSCTAPDTCQAKSCTGTCANAGPCLTLLPVCAADGGCETMPVPDGFNCAANQQCVAGVCRAALGFRSINLDDLGSFPYPTGAWVVPAGCDLVIDTGLSPPGPVDGGWCQRKAPVTERRARDDAGAWALITMTSLDVGADASVHFVGPLPVAMVVLGNATIAGLLSVAPTVTGRTPAGANDPACAGENGGAATGPAGGGGAGFGGTGGRGGKSGGAFGTPGGDQLVPLRGGCPGGSSAQADSGGSGGGALQLSVSGMLQVVDGGIITASGQGGRGGSAAATAGGGGGGSGGAVLLEAPEVSIDGFVSTNGGAGGQGAGGAGADGALAGTAPALGGSGGTGGNGGVGGSLNNPNGGDGFDTGAAGGGGGGAAGRLRVRCARSLDGGCPGSLNNTSPPPRVDSL